MKKLAKAALRVTALTGTGAFLAVLLGSMWGLFGASADFVKFLVVQFINYYVLN